MQKAASISHRIDRIKLKIDRMIRDAFMDDRAPGESFNRQDRIPSEEDVEAFTKLHSIANLLPYEAYDPDQKIYLNSDTIGIMLLGNPAGRLTDTSLRQLESLFSIKYPADACIQITLFDDARIEPILLNYYNAAKLSKSKLKTTFFDYLAKERVRFFREAKWKSLDDSESIIARNYQLIISITFPFGEAERDGNLGAGIENELARCRDTVQGTLKACGIETSNLDPTNFIQIMTEILNPSSKMHDVVEWNQYDPIKSQMVLSETALNIESSAATITHKNERFTVIPLQEKKLPTNWRGNANGELVGSFSKDLLRMPCRFLATFTVVIPEQQATEASVSYNSLRSKQMVNSQMGGWIPQWADRQRDWQYVEQKIKSGDRLLKAVYRILLITPEGTERNAESIAKQIHEACGWHLQRSRFMPIQSILGCLPMGVTVRDLDHLKTQHIYKSRLASTCVHLAPWVGEWKGTGSPVMLLMGRKGQLITFSPFDGERNYNIAVAAQSGSGKSFLTQYWLLRILALGGQAFVIDAGRSYTNLCNILGGTYIDFANKGIRINPFSSILDAETLSALASSQSAMSPAEYKDDYRKSWIPMLTGIFSQMASPDSALGNDELAILSKSIDVVIKEKGNKGDPDSVIEALHRLGEKSGRTHEIADRLTIMLDPYSSNGVHGSYFVGESNIDLNNDLVVLELDELLAKGDLATVVLYILIMQINKAVILSPDKSRYKACIIDEAWRLMGKGRVSSFIEEAYRVFRKHRGSFMTIVQAVSDFNGSQAARAAWDNSDWKLLLSQDSAALQRAEDQGLLSNEDGKIDLLKKVVTKPGRYSEIMISSGQIGNALGRFITEPFMQKLFSTRPEEAQEVRDGVASGKPIEQVINDLIKRDKGRRR